MQRCEIFRWLKTKQYAIFFLQEVHCLKDKGMRWTFEWGIQLYLVASPVLAPELAYS